MPACVLGKCGVLEILPINEILTRLVKGTEAKLLASIIRSAKPVFRTVKFTTLAYIPWIDGIGRWATVRVRRLLRLPHQKSYSVVVDLPDGLYLDVGANNGQSIESIRLFKPDARIVAFEINPPLAAKIRERYPDVDVHDVGLGDTSGNRLLHVPSWGGYEFSANASLDNRVAQRFLRKRVKTLRPGVVKQIDVEIRTLDSFNLAPVFIKIDVEGAERQVIMGALKTLRRHRPTLLIERGEQVLDLLVDFGYRLQRLEGTYDTVLVADHGTRSD